MMTFYHEMRAQEKAQWITLSHTLHQETDPQTFITFVAQGWEEGLTSLLPSSPSQEDSTCSEDTLEVRGDGLDKGEKEKTPFHRYVTRLYETHLTGVITQGVSSSKVSLGLKEEGEDRFDLHPLHLQTFRGCLGFFSVDASFDLSSNTCGSFPVTPSSTFFICIFSDVYTPRGGYEIEAFTGRIHLKKSNESPRIFLYPKWVPLCYPKRVPLCYPKRRYV